MKRVGDFMLRMFPVLLLAISPLAKGQKFISESSKISFFSAAAIENISANNTKGASIFDPGTGEVAFSIPVKEFKFAKSLMQEHFNEKYLETEKYPKSTFQGTISDYQAQATGVQNAKAKGKFTLHGITKDIEVPGTIEINGNKIVMKSKFKVKLEEYSIMRPQLLWQNIAEEIEVTIEFTFKPYEK